MSARPYRPWIPSLAALAAVASTLGCPAVPVTVTATPTPRPVEGSVGQGGRDVTISANKVLQYIDGTVMAPAELANGGAMILGTRIDDIEAGLASRQFGLLQATPSPTPTPDGPVSLSEKRVGLSLMSVRSYDLRTIPQIPSTYSDPKNAKFYFQNVPSDIAFFLEGTFETDTGTYQLLGLTRTEEAGKVTKVVVDTASTLAARELLRIWQLSGYKVSFKDLDPRDFNPLLVRIRKKLQAGFPAGFTFDPAKVALPDGEWSREKDKRDSALLALDTLSDADEDIAREVDRLYLAVNYTITRVRDASRAVIKRPVSLRGPDPTPSPTPTPTPSPTPTPTPVLRLGVRGHLTGVTGPTTVKLRPDSDPERGKGGVAVTVSTDAAGYYAASLQVDFAEKATYYEIVLVRGVIEKSLGIVRVASDGQVLPEFQGR